MVRKRREIYSRGRSVQDPALWFKIGTMIRRAEIPAFVQSLAYLIGSLETGGGTYLYPVPEQERTGAAFEWYIGKGRNRFWFRLGIELWITAHDIEEIGAYVCYGEGHPKYKSEPQLNDDQLNEIQNALLGMINAAANYGNQPQQPYYITRFIKINLTQYFSEPISIDDYGIWMLPPAFSGRSSPLSIVIIRVSARSLNEAKNIAAKQFAEFSVLALLATGQIIENYSVPWRDETFLQHVAEILPLPTVEQVFPRRKWKRWQCAPTGFPEAIYAMLRLWMKLSDENKERLISAASAYLNAHELLSKFPSASTVSFFAALSLFNQNEICAGKTICSACGPRHSHQLHSEHAAIAKNLIPYLGIANDAAKIAKIKSNLRTLYTKHRSAYAHYAIDRNPDIKGRTLIGTDHPYPEDTLDGDLLKSMEMIVRAALLRWVSEKAKEEVQLETYGLQEGKISLSTTAKYTITLPSKIWVGMRI